MPNFLWTFKRYRRNQGWQHRTLMAQGAKVHAASLDEAQRKASDLFRDPEDVLSEYELESVSEDNDGRKD